MGEPRRVLVTGASSGIGAATVRAFHEAGWEVWACARRQERLDQLVEAFPDRLHVFQLDVRDRTAVESSLSQLPLPAVLVNNAGLSRGLEPLWEGKASDWDEMLDTNVKGLLHVTRVLLGRMVAEGAGHVINIGSIAGQEAYPKGAVYCGSKAAVQAINEAMRKDACGTGVKVSCVNPGLVDTEFSTVRFHGDQQRAQQTYQGMTPLTGDDIAATILWVAQQPSHVNLAETLVLPADQASAGLVHRETP